MDCGGRSTKVDPDGDGIVSGGEFSNAAAEESGIDADSSRLPRPRENYCMASTLQDDYSATVLRAVTAPPKRYPLPFSDANVS